MRNFLQIIFFLLLLNNVYCQKFTPYHDKENGLWGIMNNSTKTPVIRGTFNQIYGYNDSIFIIKGEPSHKALVDTNGRFTVGFTNTAFFIEKTNYLGNLYPYDTLINNRLVEFPYYNPRQEFNMHWFLIDNHMNCIPTDYYPCPAWKNKINNGIPLYLQLIQKGEIQRWNKNIDSAVYYCKLAIEANPLNASVYYWGANLFIENYQENIKTKNNQKYEHYYPWIKYCIDKADELEVKNPYKYWILTKKYKFYKENLKDKKTAKEIFKRRKELKKNK